MNRPQSSQELRQWFQGLFWWTAPISLLADLITIAAVFTTKEQYRAAQQSAADAQAVIEPKVLGLVSISDAIFLTGLLTAFSVTSILYFSYRTSHTKANYWAIIIGSFTSLALLWVYLRLWLGENWWAWTFACLAGVLALMVFVLFKVIGPANVASLWTRKSELRRIGASVTTSEGHEKEILAITVAAIVLVIFGVIAVVNSGQLKGSTNQVLSTTQVSVPSVAIPTITPETSNLPKLTAPRIYNFSACKTPCDGSNATDTFPEFTSKIHLQWNYENIPVGAHYVRIWKSNGDEWVRYDCTWPGPESGVDIVPALSEPSGLRSGIWEVTISVNDQVLLREQLFVEGNWSHFDPAGVINRCYGSD